MIKSKKQICEKIAEKILIIESEYINNTDRIRKEAVKEIRKIMAEEFEDVF